VIEQAYRMGVQPDRLAQELADRNQIGSVITEVLRGKALTLITERATVTDEAGQPVDIEAAMRADEAEETDAAEAEASEGEDSAAGAGEAEGSAAGDSAAGDSAAAAPEASAGEAGTAGDGPAGDSSAEDGAGDDEPGGATA